MDRRKPSKFGPYIGKRKGSDLFKDFSGEEFNSSSEEFLSRSKSLVIVLDGSDYDCLLLFKTWIGAEPLPFGLYKWMYMDNLTRQNQTVHFIN